MPTSQVTRRKTNEGVARYLEVRIGADTWHRDETGPYSQKNNAWREFTKRRDMPDAYRNVAIQERTVTYGDCGLRGCRS